METKKAQVIFLPTEKESNITKHGDSLFIGSGKLNPLYKEFKHQHLYITSDEEIKKGDWYYSSNGIIEATKEDQDIYHHTIKSGFPSSWEKIIATTDSNLKIETSIGNQGSVMYNPLPQPSQSFIEAYVKAYNEGEIITEVLVEYEEIQTRPYFGEKDDIDECFGLILKITKDNTITIHPVNKTYTIEMKLLN